MAKQVFDLQEGKGMTAGQSTEHLRNYSVMDPDAKKYGYYDPTRVNLNFEIGKGGVVMPVRKHYSIVQRFKDNLRNRGIEDPNEKKRKLGKEPNRNTIANIMLGGSREQMLKLAFGDQKVNLTKGADNRGLERRKEIELWAKDMYNFVAKRFGEENIIAFVVHLDEKNPHVHCTVVPVNKNNKISYHDIFGHDKEECRKIFRKLHDETAAVNKDWGLERGSDINTTGARHRTSEEYWQWLKDACNDLEKEKGNKEEEIKGKQETLYFLDKEARRTEIKAKGLSKMIENLTVTRNDIQQEIDELTQEANQGKITNDELLKKTHLLTEELEGVEKKLKERREMLMNTNDQLDMLADKRAQIQHKYDDLQRAINKDLPTLHDRVLRDVKSNGWDEALKEGKRSYEDMSSYRQSLSAGERKIFDKIYSDLFDGSILEDIATRGEEIAAVTGALFLGYIEQAVNFAQTHGGGGGGPGGGWGKKDDEDDRAFMNRCFLMARMMMRPPGRKLKR